MRTKPKPATQKSRSRKASVTVRFSPVIIERLNALAERKGTDRTAQIQLAVADWLQKIEKEENQ